jgi:deoxyribodipyrimidine photolyase-related protein
MRLRFVLGDQLNMAISSLRDIQVETDVIFMCEVWQEATYVKHHKKKIAFIFSAMRHFAAELREQGYKVRYVKLDDPRNTGSFATELIRIADQYQPQQIIITEPSEYRVLQVLKQQHNSVPIEIRPDDRFLCSHIEFSSWAAGRKQLRMEYFYREMRRKYAILMEGDKPTGGKWNYDSENRKPLKAHLSIPATYHAQADQISTQVMELVAKRFEDHFGDLYPFHFAVTRAQALQALEQFIEQRLNYFGDYQDAMLQGQAWLYHSHLSFYLNCGLLLPLECAEAAQQAYYAGSAPLNAVEGFIRQIIGWREYVRGIYWLNMPDYQDMNYLQAKRTLPSWFWNGETRMNCLKQCISETKQHAYAHHIQRLMVLGNFALLAGLSVEEVNQWYMIVYADAYQWVELPNVTGMVLFADGGVLGSKPYAASGAYINKMSDYCKHCQYKVSSKNGEQACPFNYLYWDFLIRHKDKLAANQRLAMIYRTLDKMGEEKIQAIQQDSQQFLLALDSDEKV